MKRHLIGWAAAATTVTVLLAGCSHEVLDKEAKKYNMQSYQDGVLRAQSQGKGLNGRFLKQMRLAFARQHIHLTHESFAEDGRGNISYQYLIESEPTQMITLHVFTSEEELLNRIPSWYGRSQVAETATTKTEIYNNHNASLVYTSMGNDKGKYSRQVEALFAGLLERLDM